MKKKNVIQNSNEKEDPAIYFKATKKLNRFIKLYPFESLFIFAIVTILALSIGYYINFKLNFIFGDALARTFKAYITFFGNNPKIVSVGLVWPPLPTLLQLPLVLIPPFNANGFAGNILTSIFLGFTAIYLNKILKLFALEKLLRYGLLLLFVTNPMIVFYGSNGMSEMVAICFILMTTYYLLIYFDTKKLSSLIVSSVAFSCTFLVRFELITLLSIILIMFIIASYKKEEFSIREAESSIVLYFFPISFVILLWLLANWLIQGSPFDFLLGPYSNSHQAARLLSTNISFHSLKGNILFDIQYVGKRTMYLTPFFFIFSFFVLFNTFKKTRFFYSVCLLGFPILIILFHIVFLFLGQSFGWLRFSIYPIPYYYLLAGFILSKSFFQYKDNIRASLIILFIIFLTVSSLTTVYAMSSPDVGVEEYILTNAIKDGYNNSPHQNNKNDMKIAHYLTQKIKDRSILVDDSVGFPIIYFSRKPQLFIETVDSDFKKVLSDPVNSLKVKYLLVNNPRYSSNTEIISVKYPGIFYHGTDFTILEKDFGDWRLYKIKNRDTLSVK